ncbi:unnamed protein product [Ilex paraguariensis]|uniref:eIF3h C-terminal domain-containing protein n=1 Tax=Ilex paraguariensis TaxID=185542 RepID=A0ABC8TME4_9AQUA
MLVFVVPLCKIWSMVGPYVFFLILLCWIFICVYIGFCFVFLRAENMARKATGEDPLPEEDPSNLVFKPIPEPSRLDSFLITNQISTYCNQINGVAGQSFSRLYLMKALQEN